MDHSKQSRSSAQALFCIGDRPLDTNALIYSKVIASALGLQPVLLHVAPPGVAAEKSEKLLAETYSILPEGEAKRIVTQGSPKAEILRELERGEYRLLIVGTSVRDSHLPVSPLSRELAMRAKTNVLVVRNPPQSVRQLLICTGGHEVSFGLVAWGIRLAKASNAHATILHVVSGPPAMYTGLSALEEDLSEVLSRDHALGQHLKQSASMAESAGVEASIEFRHGMVIEEILRSCEMEFYDLVVIGAPLPLKRIEQLLMGRVAPKLLASCKFSTVIVRSHNNVS